MKPLLFYFSSWLTNINLPPLLTRVPIWIVSLSIYCIRREERERKEKRKRRGRKGREGEGKGSGRKGKRKRREGGRKEEKEEEGRMRFTFWELSLWFFFLGGFETFSLCCKNRIRYILLNLFSKKKKNKAGKK
jgi:hypothetical protein